ncbi:MAG TPA: helix-turn-helix domain-containing protein [Anaerotignum lactatifermentans]|nr:helix-turn-helix domain-containing protein [Anaerotignum lactatifermentans]
MKQPTFNGRELLPLSVMEAAHAGDAMAMEQVLRYYEGYINKLCTRTLYDSSGIPYVCVDEYMKRRLEIKLIHAIVVALK